MITMRDGCWFAAGLLVALAADFVLRSSNRIDTAPVAAASPAHLSTAKAHGADSLDAMLARLENRLRGGGGTTADWELLAQTYDFLARTADAANARSKHEVASPTATDAGGGRWPADLGAEIVGFSHNAWSTGVPGGAADTTPVAVLPPMSAKTQPRMQQLLSAADQARKARNYAAAKSAYEQLAALGQMSAQSWADYADVAGSLNGGRLDGLPQQYIEAALKLDPTNEKALWLKASARHEDQQYAQAVTTWSQLLAQVPTGSEDAKIFAANLAEDQRLAGASAVQNAASADGTALQASAVPAQVSGDVTLVESLRSRVPVGLKLFIVAKSINSPGAPVAVMRLQTGHWPLRFTLDDSTAMLPERKLSTAGLVTVEARVSQGGTAASHAGDLQSAPASVDPRAGKTVHLVIDHVIG